MGKPILFGNYYLLERINVGGMAEVFKAKSVSLEGFERFVAVKRILPNIAEDEEFIGMFIDEAKIAVQLTHANIAQIFDLGRVGESYFIALEYVSGKDLRAIFNHARQRGEPVPMAMACYTIMKVCEALGYAHSKRDANGNPLHFVHRDVSPQNILISYEGEIKVIDFGIAKAAGKANKTRAGILKGKFGYMSPEQVNGVDIDKRSDVFGVGICLYEILTGERLFTGESDFSTVEKVRKVDIMPPSTYNRRIPEELEQIVLKALARDPADRYQTALELHDDLQAFTYTSSNTFSRKDLSAYMRKVFAEEIEQEGAHDREYAALVLPQPQSPALVDEKTPINPYSGGLPAGAQVRDDASGATPRPGSALPSPRRRRRVPTLLGMPISGPSAPSFRPAWEATPVVSASSRKLAVPSLIPEIQSIPRGHAATEGTRDGSLAMDWDDEEMSTQIYDRPDGAPTLGIPEAFVTNKEAPAGVRPVVSAKAASVNPWQQAAPRRPLRLEDDLGSPSEKAVRGAFVRRNFALGTAAAAVVVLAVIAAVFALSGAPRPGVIHLSTIPKDALVKLDDQLVTGSSSPFVILNVKPNVRHSLEITKDGFEPKYVDVKVDPDQILQLREIILRPLESGFTLNSSPGNAQVFVDGKELAQRTPVRVTALTEGPHQVRVELEGYAPAETKIHVTLGTMLPLPEVSLVPKNTSASGAKALAKSDGSPKPAGEATPHASSTPARRPVVLFAQGILRINTRPWSQVFVDGKLIGNTPQMNIKLDPGPHDVKLVNAEFHIQYSLTVDIPPGETVNKSIDLIAGS